MATTTPSQIFFGVTNMAVFTITGDTPPEIGGAATDDRYVLDAFNVEPNQELTITDTLGTNVIQLTGGLEIASSSVSSNAMQLTLSNGAVITILGADTFDFQTGGNGVNGTGGTTETFDDFVTNTLGLAAVPAEGDAPETGGAVTVDGGGGTGGGAGQTFTLTADAESVNGTSGDDTIDGSLANSLEGDTITDAGGTDTLNATLSADLTDATTVVGIENVNLDIDAIGTTVNVDADNIVGA
ncbi:hypothetical protein, partial [Marivita sp.]|uniref:hypothetical protein n=1 Tax=Marivita sp. TaxID=2003365 RepID=UPI0025BBB62B